ERLRPVAIAVDEQPAGAMAARNGERAVVEEELRGFAVAGAGMVRAGVAAVDRRRRVDVHRQRGDELVAGLRIREDDGSLGQLPLDAPRDCFTPRGGRRSRTA